jgi:hypothetical protein
MASKRAPRTVAYTVNFEPGDGFVASITGSKLLAHLLLVRTAALATIASHTTEVESIREIANKLEIDIKEQPGDMYFQYVFVHLNPESERATRGYGPDVPRVLSERLATVNSAIRTEQNFINTVDAKLPLVRVADDDQPFFLSDRDAVILRFPADGAAEPSTETATEG